MTQLYTTGGALAPAYTTGGVMVWGDSGDQPEPPDLAPLPDLIGEDPAPYAYPTAAPWTVPNVARTPTYDGSGIAVHPFVVDTRAVLGHDFRGFRYWMVMTPYADTNDQLENPSVIISNQGWEWQVPEGLTNPLDGPPGDTWYSDTHMAWDPVGEQFVVYYRHHGVGYHAATSPDGVNWEIHRQVIPDDSVSGSLVMREPYDWWWFTGSPLSAGGGQFRFYRASSPLGPWRNRQDIEVSGTATTMWHMHVSWEADLGRFVMIGSNRERAAFPGVSENGIDWRFGPHLFAQGYTYRSTMVRADDPTLYDVWYSYQGDGDLPGSWWIKHTRIPRNYWDL